MFDRVDRTAAPGFYYTLSEVARSPGVDVHSGLVVESTGDQERLQAAEVNLGVVLRDESLSRNVCRVSVVVLRNVRLEPCFTASRSQ